VEGSRFTGDPSRVARQVLFTDPTAQTREAIAKALSSDANKNAKGTSNQVLVAGLVIGSPDFQRR
jgi:hypothetical protein